MKISLKCQTWVKDYKIDKLFDMVLSKKHLIAQKENTK